MDDNQILNLELFKDYATGILESLDPEGAQEYSLLWLEMSGYDVYRQQQGLFRGKEMADRLGVLIVQNFPSGLVGHAEADRYLVMNDNADVVPVIDRMNEAISRTWPEARVQLKAGVCVIRGGGDNRLGLLTERAQMALRTILKNPDKTVVFYSKSMDRMIQLQTYVPNHLREAIAENHIHVQYQPIIRTMTRRICGAEALARWEDPELGAIYPGEFIPILEQRHMAHLLDACIVDLVVKDLSGQISRHKGELCPVSVNLSRYDFEDCDIFRVFEDAVEKYGLPRTLLRIEVTEGAMAIRQDVLFSVLRRFHEAGYEVWMDNYGSGYASMSVLESFRFDMVKFDIRLLRDFRTKERHDEVAVILSYNVNMIKELKMGTVVVGVETEEEYLWLKQNGFEMQQGYFFGRPQDYAGIVHSESEVEDFRSRGYFSRVGAVQVENRTSDAGGIHYVDPMAILEKKGVDVHVLVVNQTFSDYLREIGIGDAASFETMLNSASGAFQERLFEFYENVMKRDGDVTLSMMYGGSLVEMQGRMIDVNPVTKSAAILIHMSLLLARSRSRGYDFQDLMRSLYNLYDRMDLVNRTEHVVERSFMNAALYGTVIEGRDYGAAVKLFAKENVRRRDQKRFEAFLDDATIDGRLQASGRQVLEAVFEVRDGEGGYARKVFMVMPMNRRGQKVMLLTMRDDVQPEPEFRMTAKSRR